MESCPCWDRRGPHPQPGLKCSRQTLLLSSDSGANSTISQEKMLVSHRGNLDWVEMYWPVLYVVCLTLLRDGGLGPFIVQSSSPRLPPPVGLQV